MAVKITKCPPGHAFGYTPINSAGDLAELTLLGRTGPLYEVMRQKLTTDRYKKWGNRGKKKILDA